MAAPEQVAALRRQLHAHGATLFLVGSLTGGVVAAVMTGQITAGNSHAVLAAHLNGLLGAFWLFGLAQTIGDLDYDGRQLRRLVVLTLVPAWANWLVTLMKAFLGVAGLIYTGHAANDLVAALLHLFVVIPTLVAGVIWVRGFRQPAVTRVP